jgi:hypothetical protein
MRLLPWAALRRDSEQFQCVDVIFACLTKIVCHICVCGLKGAIKGMGGGGQHCAKRDR